MRKNFLLFFFRSFLVLIKNLGQKSNGEGHTLFAMSETPQCLPLPLTRVQKIRKEKNGKHVVYKFICTMREYELSNFGRRHNAAQDTLVAKMDTVFMFFTNFPCKKERRNNKKYLRINNQ